MPFNEETATKKEFSLFKPLDFSSDTVSYSPQSSTSTSSVYSPVTTTTTTDSRQFSTSSQYAPVYAPQYSLIFDSPYSNLTSTKKESYDTSSTNIPSNKTSVPIDVSGSTNPISIPTTQSATMGTSQSWQTLAIIGAIGVGVYLVVKK